MSHGVYQAANDTTNLIEFRRRFKWHLLIKRDPRASWHTESINI